jgi:ABC-type bacteriocin/lantibiotic exporter with double-glycine peptidase domain
MLLNVLWGIEVPTAGSVEFAGAPLRELDLRVFRDQVALVRGDRLFEGSIGDNLRLGRSEVTVTDMREALEAVGLWEVIEALPAGFGTPAFESGLSDGQVRRLLIARAIVSRPRVLLLDGILDGIDVASREAVVRGVLAADAPWAIVLATHDPLLARLASRRYVLVDGRVAEVASGPMTRGGA